MDVDKFVALAMSGTIDDQIAKKEEEITALKSAEEIAQKSAFAKLQLPAVPSTAILSKTLQELSKDAADAVAAHVKSLAGMRGPEAWLQTGFEKTTATCPFCTQPVEGIPIVASYQAYFSKAYNDLKDDIRQHQKGAEDNFGSEAVIAIQNVFNKNVTLTEFWKRFFEVNLTSLDLADLIHQIKELHLRLTEQIKIKVGSPLDDLKSGYELDSASEAYIALLVKVADYNTACQAMNVEVTDVKTRAKGGNLVAAQKNLGTLKGCDRRSAVQHACESGW